MSGVWGPFGEYLKLLLMTANYVETDQSKQDDSKGVHSCRVAERGAPLYSVLLALIARYQLSHTTEQGRGHPSTEEQSSSQLSSWHWSCWCRYEYPAWICQCSWCLLKAATEPPALNTESLESCDYFRRVEKCIVWGKSSINRHNRTLQNGIIP